MLLNPKGLSCRTHDQINKKQFLSPFPGLSLAFFSITYMPHPSQKREPSRSPSIFRAQERGHWEEPPVDHCLEELA